MKKFLKLTYTMFAVVLTAVCFFCYGCRIFGGSDILSVRNQADTLSRKMAKTIGEGFKSQDINAVKELFCQKSQELSDIDEQIENTFYYLDGNVQAYRIGERGYESYGTENYVVDYYEFDCTVFLTADTGKEYGLTFRVQYIAEEPIRGMTAYSIHELYKTDYDFCCAGYYWESPYDGECGILTANLINYLGNGDAEAIKNLMCGQVADYVETDSQIQSAIDCFEGKPLFTERSDGLYGYSDSEEDFTCRVLSCDVTRNKDREITGIWLKIYAFSIYTDADREYDIDVVLYMKNDAAPQFEGISCFTLSDGQTNESIVSVGEWIHE